MRNALLLLAALTSLSGSSAAQDLGFLNSVFARVNRLSLSLESADAPHAKVLDRSGKSCLSLSMCGAGAEVLIDLDSRSRRIDLALGLGAGYLRPVRSKSGDNVDIRASIRSLPVISTHVIYVTDGWFHPYFRGSFGLADLWNARIHNSDGKQSELKASTFEYGVSVGVGVTPPFTNSRLILEAGHRARTFASIGYTLSEPLPASFPRELNLSTWQWRAGWQFDLRPLSKAPIYEGMWVLSKVDGMAPPFVVKQERRATESVREEILNAYLDLDHATLTYTMEIVLRTTSLGGNGAATEVQVGNPIREQGTWTGNQQRVIVLTTNGVEQKTRLIDDELMLEHVATGRRFFFKKVRRN